VTEARSSAAYRPEDVVARFLAESSGTMDDHIAAALRWVHPDAYFATGGFDPPRIKNRDDLVGDLEKAKKKLGGFKYEIITSATSGDRVLTERFDNILDHDGNVVHEYKVMGIARVLDDRIVWWRDYFYNTNEFEKYLPEPYEPVDPPLLAKWIRAGN
jgi:limonene-1,2-epoxide hydrolase